MKNRMKTKNKPKVSYQLINMANQIKCIFSYTMVNIIAMIQLSCNWMFIIWMEAKNKIKPIKVIYGKLNRNLLLVFW